MFIISLVPYCVNSLFYRIICHFLIFFTKTRIKLAFYISNFNFWAFLFDIKWALFYTNIAMNRNYHLDFSFLSAPKTIGTVVLYQIGRLFADNEVIISDTHSHGDFFELTMVTDGKGVVTANNVAIPVERNNIFISIPNDIHKIESNEKFPLKYDYLSFSVVDPILKDKLKNISMSFMQPATRLFSSTQITDLFNMALTEVSGNAPDKEQRIEGIIRLIILYVIKVFDSNIENKEDYTIPNKTDILCYKMMDYIRTNITKMKSLNELCEFTHYSYPYISAVFKKGTSQNLSDYFMVQRLEKAKSFILSGKYSLTEIAEKLNYSSIYAFSKSFKAYYKMSPLQFKKANKKDSPL